MPNYFVGLGYELCQAHGACNDGIEKVYLGEQDNGLDALLAVETWHAAAQADAADYFDGFLWKGVSGRFLERVTKVVEKEIFCSRMSSQA